MDQSDSDSASQHHQVLGNTVDRLITADISCRGVIDKLYNAAREKQGDFPITMLAAQRLAQRVKANDVVIITTGFACPPWFTVGEQDGPVGAATLARGLVLGLDAKVVLVTDSFNMGITKAALAGSGLNVGSIEEMLRLPRLASIVEFTTESNQAAAAGERMLKELNPSALIAIERPSQNVKGEYHGLTGINISKYLAKPDSMFLSAKAQGTLTIGIGDGGNELGCGLIRDSVLKYVPFSGECKCPCQGGSASNIATEVLVTATISNWGAYGIEACLSALLQNPAVLHDRQIELRTQAYCAAAGAINGGPGLLDPGADDVPMTQHANLVELLGLLVQKSSMSGQEYKYKWLHPSSEKR